MWAEKSLGKNPSNRLFRTTSWCSRILMPKQKRYHLEPVENGRRIEPRKRHSSEKRLLRLKVVQLDGSSRAEASFHVHRGRSINFENDSKDGVGSRHRAQCASFGPLRESRPADYIRQTRPSGRTSQPRYEKNECTL